MRFACRIIKAKLIPAVERSKACVYCRSLAGIVCSNPAGAWIFVSCVCCVLSGSDLCVYLISHPEESYRVCASLSECDREASVTRKPWLPRGCSATGASK